MDMCTFLGTMLRAKNYKRDPYVHPSWFLVWLILTVAHIDTAGHVGQKTRIGLRQNTVSSSLSVLTELVGNKGI